MLGATCRATRSDRRAHCTSASPFVNAFLALVVALGLQIGTNYVNDYADGVRGTDEVRVGPVRLVAGKLASVRQVKLAALVAFGVSGVAGLILAIRVSYWFIPIGLLCGLAGWAYTGGRHPYGYLGLGEVLVFVFFGLVATAGSAYVQHVPSPFRTSSRASSFPWGFALWAGVPVGLLAAALLQANNLRDIETDKEIGKKTLAVRLGRSTGRVLLRRRRSWRPAPPSAFCSTTGDGRSSPWPRCPWRVVPARLALSEQQREGACSRCWRPRPGCSSPSASSSPSGSSSSGRSQPMTDEIAPRCPAGPGVPRGRPLG